MLVRYWAKDAHLSDRLSFSGRFRSWIESQARVISLGVFAQWAKSYEHGHEA
jgi:hypothetical protein